MKNARQWDRMKRTAIMMKHSIKRNRFGEFDGSKTMNRIEGDKKQKRM